MLPESLPVWHRLLRLLWPHSARAADSDQPLPFDGKPHLTVKLARPLLPKVAFRAGPIHLCNYVAHSKPRLLRHGSLDPEHTPAPPSIVHKAQVRLELLRHRHWLCCSSGEKSRPGA